MDVSIRMISAASTVFWVLLVGFFASAVYSVKDLHLSLGEPQLNLTTDGHAIISIPIHIENMGYHNLGNFNITTKVVSLNSTKITEGSTFIPLVGRGSKITVLHNLTFSTNVLSESCIHYLFNDSSFIVAAEISLKLAEIIPVKALSNFTVPWGAPFYNFQFGQLAIEPLNTTHLKIVAPISFENHAPIEINGKIKIYIRNSENVIVGQGESTITAPQGAPYTGSAVFYVETSEITEKGSFEVYFLTPPFSYGPLVIPYSEGGP
ncbi:MAG: hypothetical protein QXJ07_04375 [Candidatus Bathyarchaeia archaeon]